MKLLLLYFQDAGDGQSKTAESLAKLQLKKFVTAIEMQSDSSLAVHVSLASCELDDTRPSHHTGITRYLAVVGSYDYNQVFGSFSQRFLEQHKT